VKLDPVTNPFAVKYQVFPVKRNQLLVRLENIGDMYDTGHVELYETLPDGTIVGRVAVVADRLPPGGYVTTRRTGLFGKACAVARLGARPASTAAHANRPPATRRREVNTDFIGRSSSEQGW
jgi:hypothetical protein